MFVQIVVILWLREMARWIPHYHMFALPVFDTLVNYIIIILRVFWSSYNLDRYQPVWQVYSFKEEAMLLPTFLRLE